MVKIAIGLMLGLIIGVFCRYFDIPLPGPPKFIGALVILSVTLGYISMDFLLSGQAGTTRSVTRPATR